MEGYFELLPNEIIEHILSETDFVSHWRLGTSCKRFLEFITKPNEYWHVKYAKYYSLNEQELACYNFDDWLDVYKQRVKNELNFLKEIKQARNQMQIKEDLPKNDDEDKKLKKFFKKTKIMTLQEVQHTVVRGRTGYEFKPDHNPYCTLLTSDNITDINFALKVILYGFLRKESYSSHRMIDVLITAISKNISSHPELFWTMLSTENLGRFIYNSDLDLPRDLPVPIGSVSLILAGLDVSSPFVRDSIHLLKYIPTDDSRIARIWSEFNVSERVFIILNNKESIGLDIVDTTACLKLILMPDVPHRREALQNIVCEVLENLPWNHLKGWMYDDSDLHQTTKKVFKDFKGNDMSLVSRLIDLASYKTEDEPYHALAALVLCTNQSEEALQLCANHEGLVNLVVENTSVRSNCWEYSLRLMKNLLKTDIGRERLWNLKKLKAIYYSYDRVRVTCTEQQKYNLFLAVLTKFNEIALSKPARKHEVIHFLHNDFTPEIPRKSMLKKTLLKFWISYIRLDPPISDDFLSEFISVLSGELTNGRMPPLIIELLETILETRPQAFDVKHSITNLYTTLDTIAIFGNEASNNLFIHLLSLESVFKKTSKDEKVINSAIDLCTGPETPMHLKVLLFSYLSHFLTSTGPETWKFASRAKEAIEEFVNKTPPSKIEWNAAITTIKPFKHLWVQKTSTECTALLGAWILLYFSSHDDGRKILGVDIKDLSAIKWLMDTQVSTLRQLFSKLE